MSWLKELKVGDNVFVKYSSRHKESQYVTVQKVGRKWIELSEYNGRVDRTQQTLSSYARIDAQYGSPNLVFSDKESCEYAGKISNMRSAIEKGIRHLTPDQVVAVAEIMGIEQE